MSVVVDAFKSLRNEIGNYVHQHMMQQKTDYSDLSEEDMSNNAWAMGSMDLITSQSLHNNIEMRNQVQQNVGQFSSFFGNDKISDLRKKKKARVRKTVPLVGNSHKPMGYNTPASKPVGYNNSRHYRNGLSFRCDEKEENANIVSDSKKAKSTSFEEYVDEIKKTSTSWWCKFTN